MPRRYLGGHGWLYSNAEMTEMLRSRHCCSRLLVVANALLNPDVIELDYLRCGL